MTGGSLNSALHSSVLHFFVISPQFNSACQFLNLNSPLTIYPAPQFRFSKQLTIKPSLIPHTLPLTYYLIRHTFLLATLPLYSGTKSSMLVYCSVFHGIPNFSCSYSLFLYSLICLYSSSLAKVNEIFILVFGSTLKQNTHSIPYTFSVVTKLIFNKWF